MISKNELKNILKSLISKEVDKDIILNAISEYCNKNSELLSLNFMFRVIQSTTSSGNMYRGMIHCGEEYIPVGLECFKEGLSIKYVLTEV